MQNKKERVAWILSIQWAFTVITFVGFTALVALISWWKTRGDNLDTQDGYYLGRPRALPVRSSRVRC